MINTLRKNKFLVVIGICFMLALSASNALAWEGHRGERHYYRNDHWYRHGWFGFDIAVSALAIGAVVEGLPYGYTTVVIGGVPYYSYGGYYYRHYPYGYVVVPAPVVVPNPVYAPAPAAVVSPVVAQPQVLSNQAEIINVPNSRGGYTPVTLIRHRNGYVGPQGEYYEGNPTVAQLKVLYGN